DLPLHQEGPNDPGSGGSFPSLLQTRHESPPRLRLLAFEECLSHDAPAPPPAVPALPASTPSPLSRSHRLPATPQSPVEGTQGVPAPARSRKKHHHSPSARPPP